MPRARRMRLCAVSQRAYCLRRHDWQFRYTHCTAQAGKAVRFRAGCEVQEFKHGADAGAPPNYRIPNKRRMLAKFADVKINIAYRLQL